MPIGRRPRRLVRQAAVIAAAAAVCIGGCAGSASAELVTLSLLTDPPGIQLIVDGQMVNTPYSFQSVVGSVHTISAPSSARVDRSNYTFAGWSDTGAQTHTIMTPASDTSYLATYRKKGRK